MFVNMSNSRVLAILFDGDSGNTFYAGQVVTGHVQFHASKRIQIRGVTLHVSGKAKTSWSEDHRPMGSDNQSHTQWYKGKEDYLNFELCVVGSTRDDSVVHIEPSLNNYPFSFVLPADMPQSFEGKFGHIRYKAKAVIHRRMSLDDKLNVPFTVLHLIDLNREPPNLREPLVMHGQPEASGCCWVSGVTEISATINRGCFVPGETLSIDGQIVNWTNANISYSTISLVQAIEFMATGSDGRVKCSKCLTTNLARVDRPLLQRGHTDSWNNVSLVVPQTYSSRLDGCRIINIRHSLEISPIFNEFSRKGLVSCPIVIGNIPLQNNFQPSVVTSQPMAYSATCNMTSDHMPPPSYESCIGFNIPVFQAPNNDVNSLPEVHRTGSTTMNKSQVIAILFDDNPEKIFCAGQLVTGHVHVEILERIKIRGIRLEVTVKAETSWTEGHGETTTTYTAKEEYMNLEINFVGSLCPAPRTRQALRRSATGRDSSIHDQLVKASPLVDQTHFKFVDVSYSGSVNFLLHKTYTLDAIVIWVQIR